MVDILRGGFWVEVRFEDYSSRFTSNMHIYILAVGSIGNLLGMKPRKEKLYLFCFIYKINLHIDMDSFFPGRYGVCTELSGY